MRRTLLAIAAIAALSGLSWLVWLRPATRGESEAAIETEVAVHVGKITRATLHAYVTAYGVVAPEPAGARPPASARVAPSLPGVVTLASCAEGQRVAKGAVLFQLDSRAADVAAERASAAAEFAGKALERQRTLIASGGTSEKLVQEAEQTLAAARADLAAAHTQQALLRVLAPLSGTVVSVNVKPGEAVDLTTVLAEVVDLDRLVANASVPSAELAPLRPGQPVEVLTDRASPQVAGTLAYVSPQVDARIGAASVRVSLPAGSGLRPGQLVTLRIVTEERKGCLAVPVESVVKDSEGGTVIALVRGEQAVQTPVGTGLCDGGLVEVEGEGLQADMPVVTEGAWGLPRETKIRVLGT